MPDKAIETYYQGFENGGYSYVGDQVSHYASQFEEELAAGKKLLRKDYDPATCNIPIEDLKYAYDPRCRPWYLGAKLDPNYVVLTSYLSLDGA